MTIKTIQIEQLKIGMYICEIDIAWIHSPFLRHKFVIKTPKEINLLKEAGVKQVKIDITQGLDVEKTEKPANEEPKQPLEGESTIEKNETQADHNLEKEQPTEDNQPPQNKKLNASPPQSSSRNDELEFVQELKEKANQTFQALNHAIANNESFETKQLVPVIDETISSLMRNNQALLTMMHLRRYDKELFTHSFSVMTLSLSLGMALAIEEKELQNIGIASLMHDLGWARLPLHLLGKSRAYTENEVKVVQKHIPIVVSQLLKNKEINSDVILMISQHHERIDGSGYPAAKKQDEINSTAQIIGLIDSYDEMVHGLLDSPGMVPSLALKNLFLQAKQGKYEIKLVQKLIALLGIYPVTSAVLLTSSEKAVVIEINEGKPLTPIVKIYYDRDGRALVNPIVVDLLKDEAERKIKNPLDLGDKKNDPLQLLAISNYKSMV